MSAVVVNETLSIPLPASALSHSPLFTPTPHALALINVPLNSPGKLPSAVALLDFHFYATTVVAKDESVVAVLNDNSLIAIPLWNMPPIVTVNRYPRSLVQVHNFGNDN